MNRVQYGSWIPGAVIRVFSGSYGVWHFGIAGPVVGMVFHASKDRGQFLPTTHDEFAEGQTCVYTWLPDDFHVQQAVLNRANSQVGSKFQLLASNCEDFVNWVVTGVARSPQRENRALAALVALIIGGLIGL